ncbi:MAG: DUF4058 family protein [Gemmataceae bacterium]
MPSPFPGMDPYLEDPARWADLHGALIYAIRAALTPLLPERYSAGVDQYVWLHEPDLETRRRLVQPNVFVTDETGTDAAGTSAATALAALAAPAVSTLPVVRRTGPRYVRITDPERRRVVTVIELLSPSNKDTAGDRDLYLAKRNEYLATGVNLVEIDLLRAGERLPLGDPAPVPGDYYVVVSLADAFPHVGVWSFTVRDPLPVVPVPLGGADPAVRIDLRVCLDRAYDDARYRIDYDRPPTPRLRKPDAAWARDLLANR